MSKRIRWAMLYSLVTLCTSNFVLGQVSPGIGVTQSLKNSQQIAMLHWYDANLTTTFTVGHGPEDMAFDGTSLWIANFFGNNVTKLQPSTGKVLATFPVGNRPWGVAYDGANVWVTNVLGDSVTKLRASDGKKLAIVPLPFGATAFSVAFDGANIWVVNSGFGQPHVLAPSVYVLGITFTLEKRRALQILFCYCHRRRQPNLLRLPESYYRCL